MSSLTLSNTFGSQTGPIPLAQLDTNYLEITAYANNPYNRNSYATDSGTTNTIAISLDPAPGGLTAGLEIAWRQLITNSGTAGVAVSVNSLGARSLLDQVGNPVGSGFLMAGVAYRALYNGTAFYTTTAPPAALMAKAVACWSGTASLTITPIFSSGIASVVSNGTGTYLVTMQNAHTGTVFPCFANASTNTVGAEIVPQSASSVLVITTTFPGVAANAAFVNFLAYGVRT